MFPRMVEQIVLPAGRPRAADGRKPDGAASLAYVVSKSKANQFLIQSLLSKQGICVKIFDGSDEFVNNTDRCDSGLLLLDITDSGEAEIALLESLQAQTPRFAAIVMAQSGDVPIAVQAMRAGAIDVIEKPFDGAQLLDRITAGIGQFEARNALENSNKAALEKIARLSRRERAVFDGLIRGLPNKIIAGELKLSQRTVEIYRANMMAKLEVKNLSQVLILAFVARLRADTLRAR